MATRGIGHDRTAYRWLRGRRGPAVGVVLLAMIGLAILLSRADRVATITGWAIVLIALFTLATLVIANVVRRELARQAGLVTSTAERWLVEVLPPARVMHLLLERVYGPSEANRDVITALLGGEGLAADCADLTISEHTEIDHQLTRVDEYNYELVTEARYSFRNRVPTDSIVIFVTSDTVLRDSIISACRLPLFELWFVPEGDDTPMFAESVESIRGSVRIGIQYVDSSGRTHDLPAANPGIHLRDIKLQHWGDYLTFFRGGSPGESLRRQDYLGTLRIFEVNLHDLAPGDLEVMTVQRLTVRSATIQQHIDGFCYWQAPYPCFVERIRFDTTSFDQDDETDLWFRLKPFTIQSQAGPATWSTSDKIADIPIGSWMLPGHGTALVWRPRQPVVDVDTHAVSDTPTRNGVGSPKQ